ncbi:MAG: hypothetical protein WCT20_05305, partial [Candidatus Babeliales bacterium]
AVEKALVLYREIFIAFYPKTFYNPELANQTAYSPKLTDQMAFYNPELAHTFYTTCTLLDDVTHAQAFQPRHIRKLYDNALQGAKLFTHYLASRKMFLKEQDVTFLQNIITFYQLLCGIYSDEYCMFGLAERIADCCIHRPWEFICENPEIVILVGAIVGIAIWYYLIDPWLEKRNRAYDIDQDLVALQKGARCGEFAMINAYIAANFSEEDAKKVHKYIRRYYDLHNEQYPPAMEAMLKASKAVIVEERRKYLNRKGFKIEGAEDALVAVTKKEVTKTLDDNIVKVDSEIERKKKQIERADKRLKASEAEFEGLQLKALKDNAAENINEGRANVSSLKQELNAQSFKKVELCDTKREVGREVDNFGSSEWAPDSYIYTLLNNEEVNAPVLTAASDLVTSLADKELEIEENVKARVQRISNNKLEKPSVFRGTVEELQDFMDKVGRGQEAATVIHLPGHWIVAKAIPAGKGRERPDFVVYDSVNESRATDHNVTERLDVIAGGMAARASYNPSIETLDRVLDSTDDYRGDKYERGIQLMSQAAEFEQQHHRDLQAFKARNQERFNAIMAHKKEAAASVTLDALIQQASVPIAAH